MTAVIEGVRSGLTQARGHGVRAVAAPCRTLGSGAWPRGPQRLGPSADQSVQAVMRFSNQSPACRLDPYRGTSV